MARLPTPGGDDGNWGTVLNDYLSVEHNTNGTLKKSSLITGAEQMSRKNQPGGYVGMTSDTVIDPSYLPSMGVGNYMGVRMSATIVPTDTRIFGIEFETTTATIGDALAWSLANPDVVIPQSTGVYAVVVTVNWNDENVNVSPRFVQIISQCMFHTEEQRNNIFGVTTIQSISMTMTLQELQGISVYIEQNSGEDLTPHVTMLVTKVAHAVLPI